MPNLSEMKTLPPTNRLVGDMPKIGIRPVIDGRRKGIRESLEDVTMGLAKATAQFLSSNLSHNGQPTSPLLNHSCK